ncbi:hypothetical protein [Acinetobacter baumannii]|uniref:hypothetical protein n=1 Tax=Acinetobacter baumannii TaxID=470 RepID=UPI0013607AE5|nr:hypothetical protein [Acinetobacter baumannii]CAA0263410.1 hypothetical protein AB945B12_03091 [Acinetobacter baumannii]
MSSTATQENKVSGDGRGTTVGPYFEPGRQFAWANSDNTHINQHLTGMDQTTLAKYLAGYAQPTEQASASSQTNHLKLNWEQTLELQAKGQNKFQQLLQIEQEFTRDSDCKPKEIISGCKALDEYQKQKSNDKTGSATIVYSTDPTRNEII